MTRDDFVPRLESYLDDFEGATPLPESVRMAVRAELPRMKQIRSVSGPARYMSMMSTRAAQIALGLAAAALVVAVGAFLSSGRNIGDGGPSPTSAATPTASVAPSTAPTCDATTVGASGDRIEVTWCARGVGEPGAISFTMDGPAAWIDQYFAGFGSLWLRPEQGGAITFALVEDQTVDEVISDLTAREGYVVGDESIATLGGQQAAVLDLSLAEGTSDAEPLIEDPDQTWQLQEGSITRVWIVDVDGSTVMIATGESLADAVGEALQTIEWGP